MSGDVDYEFWLQSRRIGEMRGRLAALEDIRLRLIEMSDLGAADALGVQIDGLRRCLDYQQRVLVAMRARLAIKGMDAISAMRVGSFKAGSDRAAPGSRRVIASSAPAARSAGRHDLSAHSCGLP